MEPRSSPQQLPQGKGNEQVMKEEIEVKLAVAEDTDDGEMEHREDTRSRIEYYGRRKENLKEADGVKLDVPEDTEPQPISLLVSLTDKGKDQMKEAIEEELDAPKESDETDAESSMAAQRNLSKEGGEIEEHHVDARLPSESQETDSGKGKEQVDESDVLQNIIARDNAKGKEKVIEANMVQIIIARDKGKGKEKVNEANVVQKIIIRDNGHGEEHPETPETTRESLSENGRDQDNGKGTEKVNEAIVVQIIIIRDNEAQTLDAPPYAESSTAAERRLAEGEGEIQKEPQEGDRTTPESLNQEQDPIFNYEAWITQRSLNKARSIVERAKGKCALYRVHSRLRDVSAKQYEPVLVSIGPYHHGKTRLQDMEERKEYYLQVLRRRVNEKGFVEALKNEKGEPHALHCYRDSHRMMKLQDSFGECMVRDGCFIIELFRRIKKQNEYEDFSNDKLFNMDWMWISLRGDMILFENQIPLFVLRTLLALIEKRPDIDKDFLKQALGFFEFNGEPIPSYEFEIGRLDDIPHLLGLVYEALVVSKRQANLEQETPKLQNSRRSESLLLEYLINIWSRFVRIMKALWSRFVRIMKALWSRFVRIRKASVPGTPEQPNYDRVLQSWEPIWTAVALEQVGVRFVKANQNALFHDIGFSGGELSIPRLVIYDETESLFRNLVAYEQYSENNCLHRVVDYLYVMDCLINSSKDVELLRHCGIIENVVGDDEKVSTMLNRLLSNVCYSEDDFFYKETFNSVNEFCKNPWSLRIAKLKTEYFSSPWSVISFLAAVLLLLLTATQTMYAVLSYHHPKS